MVAAAMVVVATKNKEEQKGRKNRTKSNKCCEQGNQNPTKKCELRQQTLESKLLTGSGGGDGGEGIGSNDGTTGNGESDSSLIIGRGRTSSSLRISIISLITSLVDTVGTDGSGKIISSAVVSIDISGMVWTGGIGS